MMSVLEGGMLLWEFGSGLFDLELLDCEVMMWAIITDKLLKVSCLYLLFIYGV